jgi:transcriptional regulator with XRE-family HTH domain
MTHPPIGRRLAALRESRGMTVGEVAEAMGVTHTRVWHIEHGQKDVKVTTAERYLDAVGARLAIVLLD